MLVVVAYALDAVAHYWALRRVTAALPGFVAVQELFGAAQRLVERPLPALEPEQASIRAQLEVVKDVALAVATIGTARIPDETLAEYFDIFTLRQERLFCDAAPLVAARSGALADLALRVGELDALQALASWRSGLAWCPPDLRVGTPIVTRAVRHPLVASCVPNDVRLAPAVLVTGSNMSGKSTYLRAVALNALLAQVVHTCLAGSWSGPPLRLMTCLRRADSVLAGRSAYLAEAQGVLDIVRVAGGQPRLLCVLDEIFRGTNSLERVAAATEAPTQSRCSASWAFRRRSSRQRRSREPRPLRKAEWLRSRAFDAAPGRGDVKILVRHWIGERAAPTPEGRLTTPAARQRRLRRLCRSGCRDRRQHHRHQQLIGRGVRFPSFPTKSSSDVARFKGTRPGPAVPRPRRACSQDTRRARLPEERPAAPAS